MAECNDTLTVGTDNYVTATLGAKADGTAITTVTSVTAQLQDSTGTLVTDSLVTMTLKSGTTYTYEGTIPDTVSLTAGTTYARVITAIVDGLTSVDRTFIVAGSAFASVLDIPDAIASIDDAIASGISSVTVDGVTTNFRSQSELLQARRVLVDRDNSGNFCKRRRVQRINLGGF